MINSQMRFYDYLLYGDDNGYGQASLDEIVKGSVKIAITSTVQSVQDNINYKGAQYIGLTKDKSVNDKFIIKYGDERLKVLYTNPAGRYIQVFMSEM